MERSRDESADVSTFASGVSSSDISETIDRVQVGVDKFYAEWGHYLRTDTNQSVSESVSGTNTTSKEVPSDSITRSHSQSPTLSESECKHQSLQSLTDSYSNPNDQLQIAKLLQQIDALKRENLELKDESSIHWKQSKHFREQYESERREKQFYQIRLKGLATMIKRGPPPRPECVRMNKANLRITQRIHEIKIKIKRYYDATYPSTKWRVVIHYHETHQSWTTKTALSQIIKNHLKHNGVDNSKPDILQKKPMKKRSNPRRTSSKNLNENNLIRRGSMNGEITTNSGNGTNSDHTSSRRSSTGSMCSSSSSSSNVLREIDVSGNLSHYTKTPYDCVVEVFIIKTHRIEALRSGYQRGLKARMDIVRGTVIGQYIGVEYLDQEFQDVFSHSNEESVRNVYAFDQILNVPVGDHNGDRNGKKGMKMKEMKMIIDGYGLREMVTAQTKRNMRSRYSAHMLYINDCRADISNEHPTEEDAKYWKVDFVNVEVNGYAMVFVVARCDIKQGEELLSWYGASYNGALRQQSEYERMKNSITTLVDNTILQGCDMENDVWTIE